MYWIGCFDPLKNKNAGGAIFNLASKKQKTPFIFNTCFPPSPDSIPKEGHAGNDKKQQVIRCIPRSLAIAQNVTLELCQGLQEIGVANGMSNIKYHHLLARLFTNSDFDVLTTPRLTNVPPNTRKQHHTVDHNEQVRHCSCKCGYFMDEHALSRQLLVAQ